MMEKAKLSDFFYTFAPNNCYKKHSKPYYSQKIMTSQVQTQILVGLSGGPDSVALLHMLHNSEVGGSLVATHCNFHLRGEESDRDEQFCRNLCQAWGIQLLVKQFDTRQYMAQHKVSLELAARQLRYDWWQQLCSEAEAKGIKCRVAVAHHIDDSLETMLFNLMRGTGIKGLTGIPAIKGPVIRPLLSWNRQQILDYIAEHKLSYITDSSNLEDEATRNKIRLHLLPLMEQILPQARKGLETTMHHLQETRAMAESFLNILFSTTSTYDANGIKWKEWSVPTETDEFSVETLFHEWSSRYGSEQSPAMQHGNLFYTAPSTLHMQPAFIETQLSQHPGFAPGYELFDLDRITLPLTYRHWLPSDRIQPLGMKGSRLVSDIFSDAHLSPMHKATTWVVADATGQIIWVVGHKVSELTKVSEATKHILQISMQ